MKPLHARSLEALLRRYLVATTLVILLLQLAVGLSRQWSALAITLMLSSSLLLLWLLSLGLWRKTLTAFNRANLHLEAIRMEDYNQHAKPAFSQGKVADFHKELEQLSDRLLEQKSRYDQHIFLVYRLIDQLDAPILVFNEKLQLSYANGAFSDLYGHPWQMYRHASPGLLGLQQDDKGWQFEQHPREPQWQIRHSEFIDMNQTHQLLVFINIKSALRENQLAAWQQIIRVLGHEIRNSLTPVSTLAQSLESKVAAPREKQALGVITERCQHLQDFVSRYSSIAKQFSLSCQWLATDALGSRLRGLFEGVPLEIQRRTPRIWADAAFLEQVLINLIKNAVEASPPDSPIQLRFAHLGERDSIEVIDAGQGFANLDNLFVPFYSTKQQGQGIGLSFCRNIIEQHGGEISLANNEGAPGVTVTVLLPSPKAE